MFLLFAGGVCSFSYQEIRMALAEKRKIFGHNKVKWKINFAHCTIFVIWFFYNHIKRVKCEKKGIFQTHFWSIPDIEGKCEFRKPLRSQMTKTPVLFSRQIPESGLDSRYMTAWTNALVQLKMGESLLLLLRARFWEENLSEKNSLPPFFCRKKSSPLQKKSIRPPYFTWKKVFAPLNTAMKATLFIVSIILQWTHQSHLTQHRLLYDLQKWLFWKIKSWILKFFIEKKSSTPFFFEKKAMAREPHKFLPVPMSNVGVFRLRLLAPTLPLIIKRLIFSAAACFAISPSLLNIQKSDVFFLFQIFRTPLRSFISFNCEIYPLENIPITPSRQFDFE